MSDHKTYLGDGVYIDFEFDQIRLTTEDGLTVTNIIILEPEVVIALLEYLERIEVITRLLDINTGEG